MPDVEGAARGVERRFVQLDAADVVDQVGGHVGAIGHELAVRQHPAREVHGDARIAVPLVPERELAQGQVHAREVDGDPRADCLPQAHGPGP